MIKLSESFADTARVYDVARWCYENGLDEGQAYVEVKKQLTAEGSILPSKGEIWNIIYGVYDDIDEDPSFYESKDRSIKNESYNDEETEYRVTVNFAGYYGCDKDYDITAHDEDDAKEQAIQEALNSDIEIDNVELIDEDEHYNTYEVTVSFCGYFDCDRIYTLEAINEDDAREMAHNEAEDDLEVTDIVMLSDLDEFDESYVKEAIEPRFKVGDIITNKFDDPSFNIKAKKNRYKVVSVNGSDPYNGFTYTIEPADAATVLWWKADPDMKDYLQADISGFEHSPEEQDFILAE